jgi:hypothetical protein
MVGLDGPAMTVMTVRMVSLNDMVMCTWFPHGVFGEAEYDDFRIGKFPEAALEPARTRNPEPELIMRKDACPPIAGHDVWLPPPRHVDTQVCLPGDDSAPRTAPAEPGDADPVAAFASSWRDRPPAWRAEGGEE